MESVTPKVFISATSSDLKHVREEVRDALLNLGCLPIVQDHFNPDYREISEILKNKIEECDALIHIAGLRYGMEPNPCLIPQSKPRRSYTQIEYDLARELKLAKVFVFICDENFPYFESETHPIVAEPLELTILQNRHRERLLNQKEIHYRINSLTDVNNKVRELQLELNSLRKKSKKVARRLLVLLSSIAVLCAAICPGVYSILIKSNEVSSTTSDIQEKLETQELTPLVLEAYQTRFQEIRDDPYRKVSLSNSVIDGMVKNQLPEITGISRQSVDRILKIEAPHLARKEITPINLRLAALFAMGEYDATLKQGEQLLVSPTISGLQTLGDAAQAKFDEEPNIKFRADAVRYYSGALALIDKKSMPLDWAESAIRLGSLLSILGDFENAEALLVEVHDIYKIERDDSGMFDSINNLALLYIEFGFYEEAESVLGSALSFYEEKRGRDDPSILVLLSNIALLLEANGNIDEAETLTREVLEKRKLAFSQDHPDTLNSINNLSALLLAKGNYIEAERGFRKGLEAHLKKWGPDHPFTLYLVSNLAVCLQEQKKFKEAGLLYNQVLETRERILGRSHPDTLTSINNFAGLLQQEKNDADSELLYQELIERREAVLGRHHPDTLISISAYATLLSSNGRYEEAHQLFDVALHHQERILGRNHPSTLNTMSSIASSYFAQARYSDTEQLYRVVLKWREAISPEHFSTLNAKNNLALTLHYLGNHQEAEKLSREVLQINKQRLGSGDPDTVRSMINLALILVSLSKFEEAEALYQKALTIREEELGRRDLSTLGIIGNIAELFFAQEKYEKAEPFYREVYEAFEAFGEEHLFPESLKEKWDACIVKIEADSK